MVKSVTIPYHELTAMLEDFSALVEEKKEYTKMPYDMWRKMNHPKTKEDVIVEWDQCNVEFCCDELVHHFETNDHSFGQFFIEYCADYLDYKFNHYYDYDGTYYRALSNQYTNATNLLINDAERKWLNSGTIASTPDTKADIEIVGLDQKADVATVSAIESRVSELENKVNNTNENEKENNVMKGFNFDFGPVNSAVVRMSMYGLAIKNKTGSYVSYDAKNEEIVDVDIFNFDGAKYIWKMPVAIKDIAIGDTIVHQNVPMFVVGISEDQKALFAVDPVVGERKEIMLTRSPFGFNFATKVVNLLGNMFNGEANAENPFGNMWMLMAMGDGNMDMNMMLPMMMMGQNNVDPTMMMVMMAMNQGDNKAGMDNILPLMWAMNNMNKPTCNCGCGEHH